jgi:diamine N-acetyltransferase
MSALPLTIKPCTADDVETLLEVGRESFWQAFWTTNAPHNMEAYMSQAFRPEVFLKEIAQPDSRFFLAEAGGQPAAYLKINFVGAQSDVHDPRSLEVERLYVLEAFHGRGIGRELLTLAVDTARAAALDYVWLGVWEHNYKAQAFYQKQGFEVFGAHPFLMGDDLQTDLLMRKAL